MAKLNIKALVSRLEDINFCLGEIWAECANVELCDHLDRERRRIQLTVDSLNWLLDHYPKKVDFVLEDVDN